MAGLVPGIHVLCAARKAWMAGTSPAMTLQELRPQHRYGSPRASS
jgi:hypothetical protein